jgi:hypothetical protein
LRKRPRVAEAVGFAPKAAPSAGCVLAAGQLDRKESPEQPLQFGRCQSRTACANARTTRSRSESRSSAPQYRQSDRAEIEELIKLRTLGAQTKERLLETYTLVVDGLGITLFGALICLDGARRRARRRWPSG